jgi:hypothetical protein
MERRKGDVEEKPGEERKRKARPDRHPHPSL